MNMPLTLYQIHASPHCIKVRLAMSYKGLEFQKNAVEPFDRTAVIDLSGQPHVPVLVHGERVLPDSYAILRYLDSNFFQEDRRLYSSDYKTMRQIENYENFARLHGTLPVGIMMQQVMSQTKDAEQIANANDILQQNANRLEKDLDTKPYLMGEKPTAADFSIAPMMFYGMLPASESLGPIGTFFRQNLAWKGCEKVREWVVRTMEWEREGESNPK